MTTSDFFAPFSGAANSARESRLWRTLTQATLLLLTAALAPRLAAGTATFTSSGTWTVPAGVTSVEVLVVAGGGGGAGPGTGEGAGRGGGGGGGVKHDTSYSVTPGGTVSVTVGAGGAADSDGGNSTFGTVTAHGGGHGGTSGSSAASGGSGGGSSYVGAPGSGTSGEGNSGGYGLTDGATYGAGGGGGGASAAGADASSNGGIGVGGAGGAGFTSSISGSSVTYGSGGGGGGDNRTGAPGGAGGSGAGAGSGSGTGSSGTANRGGGGGGGDYNNNGGSGGSGIVVIAWPDSGPPTVTSTTTGYALVSTSFSYQITASGTPTVTSFGASNLPPGLSVNTSTGLISGTPTIGGSFTVTLNATNSAGTGNVNVTFWVANQSATYTSSGTWTVPSGATSVDVLVVGGGGGGGSTGGGGGGGGGVIHNRSYAVTPAATITVTVGAGGSGGAGGASNAGTNGGNSVFDAITGYGGGGGGTYFAPNGASGGSGGGAGEGTGTAGAGTAGQGHNGGDSGGGNTGGGGGGAAAAGSGNAGSGGNTAGGAGLLYNGTYYGAGGGGGNGVSNGGSASAGAGASGADPGGDATAHTGSGGGGGGNTGAGRGGNGGSGVVIFNWLIPLPGITSATIATATVGTPESYQITANNTPTSFGASSLPTGLSVNTSTGAITGTPTVPGIYASTITATNTYGTGSATLTWTVGLPLPYAVGFESAEGYTTGSLTGQAGWAVTPGSATVVTSEHVSGTRGLSLDSGGSAAIAQQIFSSAGSSSVVFLDLYAKPVAATTAASSSLIQTESAAIGFQISSGRGEIYAFDGVGANQWVGTGIKFDLNGSDQSTTWLHLTIRADYTHHTWDLYVDGVMADYDLAFSSNSESYLRLLALKGVASAAAYVDDIAVQSANPLFTDADKDGMPDSWETTNGLSTSSDDRSSDHDGDGRTNIEEYFLGTAANNADVTNPTAVSGLTVTGATTTTTVGLSWTAGSDSGAGTSGVAGYNIYRNGVKLNLSPVTGLTYTDSGLSASSSYTYVVRTVDLAGNLSSAVSVLVTTSATGGFEMFTPLP